MCIDAHYPIPGRNRRGYCKNYQEDGGKFASGVPVLGRTIQIFCQHFFLNPCVEQIPKSKEYNHSYDKKQRETSCGQRPVKKSGFTIEHFIKVIARNVKITVRPMKQISFHYKPQNQGEYSCNWNPTSYCQRNSFNRCRPSGLRCVLNCNEE